MRRFLLMGLTAVLALAGCTSAQVSGTPTGTSRADATFVYLHHLEIITDWDPASSYSNEIVAMQNIYDSLTIYNPVTRRASPRLAVRWRSSEGGKVWTFTLRDGVVFHTGRPVTAASVKSSIERTRQLAAGASYIWDVVDRITVLDPLTVQFTLRYPAPLDLIASSGYAAYIYDTQAAGNGDLAKWFQEGRDAGSGPYTVASWRKGQQREVVLRAFDRYWGGWDGPHYTTVEFHVSPNSHVSWRMLLRGQASFVERLDPLLFRQAKATPGIRTLQVPSFQNLLVLFNTASGPLRDVRLRKAVQKAIDYDGLITALRGAGDPATGLVPEGLLGYRTAPRPRQDLQGAAELLQQAGYGPTGQPLRLTMTYAQGDADEQMLVETLRRTLSQLNVTLDARAMPWNAQWNKGKSLDPTKRQDIFMTYWYPDYADAYSWFVNIFRSADPVTFNLAYLANRDIDARIDNLPSLLATDRTAAQQEYRALQSVLIERQAAVAVPWVLNYQRAYLGNIKGYTENPAYPNVVFAYPISPGG